MYDGAGQTIRPKMAEVKAVVAKHNGVTVADLESECRKRNFAWPRQIAEYLCREMTARSYPEIGRTFGDRDHTSIIFAFRKVKRLRDVSPELEATLEVYRRDIREAAAQRAVVEDTVRIRPRLVDEDRRRDRGGVMSDVDLFGQPVAPVLKTTGWGEHVDRLAREAGGWSDDVVVYAMEVLGDINAPNAHKYIQMTGDVPCGHHANGSLKWPTDKAASPRTAIVSMAAYSVACNQHKAAKATGAA